MLKDVNIGKNYLEQCGGGKMLEMRVERELFVGSFLLFVKQIQRYRGYKVRVRKRDRG